MNITTLVSFRGTYLLPWESKIPSMQLPTGGPGRPLGPGGPCGRKRRQSALDSFLPRDDVPLGKKDTKGYH